MQQTIETGQTDDFGETASIIDESHHVIHLVADHGFGHTHDLPDNIEAPFGSWQFSAPYKHGAVLLSENIADVFGQLTDAFEELGHFVVTFPREQFVRCMLDHLASTGPYDSSEQLVHAYYDYDMAQGEHIAPMLSHADFNEMHLEGVLELEPDACTALHQWITHEHPEYDLFLPEMPSEPCNLEHLDKPPA